MEEMIKCIIDMDKKAREITDAAQQEKIDCEKEIAQKALHDILLHYIL